MRFAPEYVAYVLNENFEDAKTNFLSPLMALHYAHLVMLTAQRIVSKEDAHAIREALDSIDEAEVRGVVYDGTYEDLFFYLDRLIVDACGAEHVAHTTAFEVALARMRPISGDIRA